MYHGRIPPHLWIGDRVTISKAAQEKLDQSIKNETVEVSIEFEQEGEPLKGSSRSAVGSFYFLLATIFAIGLCVGTILAHIEN